MLKMLFSSSLDHFKLRRERALKVFNETKDELLSLNVSLEVARKEASEEVLRLQVLERDLGNEKQKNEETIKKLESLLA